MPDFKLFTLAEAERTLPLVRRSCRTHGRVSCLARGGRPLRDPDRRRAGRLGRDPGAGRRAGNRHQARRADQSLPPGARGHRRGVQRLRGGLVDFYSLREDRPIFLCWRLGEERISHWHETTPDSPPPADRRCHPLRRSLVIRLWLFVHLLGFTMWLGGALASMVPASRPSGRTGWASAPWRGRRRRCTRPSSRPVTARGALGPDPHLSRSPGARASSWGSTSGWSSCRARGWWAPHRAADRAAHRSQACAAGSDPGPGAAFFDELRQRQKVVASVSGAWRWWRWWRGVGSVAAREVVGGSRLRHPEQSEGARLQRDGHAAARSSHSGFVLSINATFRRRVQPFSCFSL